MNINPNIYTLHHNLNHNQNYTRKPIFQTHSPSLKINMHKLTQPIIQPKQMNDYQLQKRKTLKFLPFHNNSKNKVFLTQTKEIPSRIQRGSQPINTKISRENHFINPQDTLNNSSRQKLKLLSNGKASPFSRSENSSARKLRGIELTKSKGISGMYNDKDFEVRQSFTNVSQKSNEGLPKNGKLIDEYQMNDYQTPTKMIINSHHPHLTESRSSTNYNIKSQLKKSINKQTAEHIQIHKNLQQSSPKMIQPQRQLLKARSYDMFSSKTPTHPQNPITLIKSQLKRQSQPQNIYKSDQYLLPSKRKTLDELSLKQSLIIQFDPYRR